MQETKVKDSIIQQHQVIKNILDQVNHLKEDKSKQMKRHKTIPVPEMLTSSFVRSASPILKCVMKGIELQPYWIHQSTFSIQKNFQSDRKSIPSFRLNMSVNELPLPVTTVSLYDCFERNPSSTDVLLAKSKMLFNKYEFQKCLKCLDQILSRDPFHIVSVTYQIGCLFEIRDYNSK